MFRVPGCTLSVSTQSSELCAKDHSVRDGCRPRAQQDMLLHFPSNHLGLPMKPVAPQMGLEPVHASVSIATMFKQAASSSRILSAHTIPATLSVCLTTTCALHCLLPSLAAFHSKTCNTFVASLNLNCGRFGAPGGLKILSSAVRNVVSRPGGPSGICTSPSRAISLSSPRRVIVRRRSRS